VEAWYPGEEGGTAVADVLFGDYNPAGRLPVTFYKSAEQLPPFEDYAIAGRTYRYFKGEPLYPFGHGLSYTKLSYSGLKLSADKIKAGQDLKVSAEVKNSGPVAGDEVVQLYVSRPNSTLPAPIRSLRGFKRIHLSPGETQRVEFSLTPKDMSVVNETGASVVEAGQALVSLGGKQPGFKGTADSPTTEVLTCQLEIKGPTITVK